MSNWINYEDWISKEIPENIKSFSIDTRDFTAVFIDHFYEGFSSSDLTKINKQERFFFTTEELIEAIKDIYIRSGGKGEWRMLNFKGVKYSTHWSYKYLRIQKVEKGWLVASSEFENFLNKTTIKAEIEKEYLNHH